MRTGTLVVVVVAALITINCGSVEPTSPTPVSGGVPSRSSNNGTAPQPAPAPSPSPSPTPAPATGTGNLQVTISPNPVPFSGQAITDIASCRDRPNTWFYDQVLKESGGVAITITSRVDTFDGVAGAASNPNLRIAANGTTTLRTRWCSVSSGAHTAQTTFSGTDANGKTWRVAGPTVRLSAR